MTYKGNINMREFVNVLRETLSDAPPIRDDLRGGNSVQIRHNLHPAQVHKANVTAVFTEIEEYILERLSDYNAALGCSPWISEASPIIQALTAKDFYSLITSWEEMKDKNSGQFCYPEVRRSGKAIPDNVLHPKHVRVGEWVEVVDKEQIDCLQYIKAKRLSERATARMHSKFLVLGHYDSLGFRPIEVITGSFNFTFPARNNLENVVSILNEQIADAYTRIWHQSLLISLYEQNPRLISNSEWLDIQLKTDQQGLEIKQQAEMQEVIDDPHSSHNYAIKEREREREEDEID